MDFFVSIPNRDWEKLQLVQKSLDRDNIMFQSLIGIGKSCNNKIINFLGGIFGFNP